MICTSCFEADTVTEMIQLDFLDIPTEGEKCPKCGEVVFTHDQSIAIDIIRLRTPGVVDNTSQQG